MQDCRLPCRGHYFQYFPIVTQPQRWARAISRPVADVFNRWHVVWVGFIGPAWNYLLILLQTGMRGTVF